MHEAVRIPPDGCPVLMPVPAIVLDLTQHRSRTWRKCLIVARSYVLSPSRRDGRSPNRRDGHGATFAAKLDSPGRFGSMGGNAHEARLLWTHRSEGAAAAIAPDASRRIRIIQPASVQPGVPTRGGRADDAAIYPDASLNDDPLPGSIRATVSSCESTMKQHDGSFWT